MADQGEGVVNYESTQQQPNTKHEATTDVRSPQPGVAQIVLGGEHDLSTAVQLEETSTRRSRVAHT
jgi:hypothetical protein